MVQARANGLEANGMHGPDAADVSLLSHAEQVCAWQLLACLLFSQFGAENHLPRRCPCQLFISIVLNHTL